MMEIIEEPRPFFRRFGERRRQLGYRICRTLRPVIYVLRVAVLSMAALALFLYLCDKKNGIDNIGIVAKKHRCTTATTTPLPQKDVTIRLGNDGCNNTPHPTPIATPMIHSLPPAPVALAPIKEKNVVASVPVLDLTATTITVVATPAQKAPLLVSMPEKILKNNADAADNLASICLAIYSAWDYANAEIDSCCEAVIIKVNSAIEYGVKYNEDKKVVKKRRYRRRR